MSDRHVMNVATNSTGGFPHLVAMWYGFLNGAPAFWTYRKSQKIRNLQRDNRLTCLVESGEGYHELQGVMLVGRGIILENEAEIFKIGASVYERYSGPLTDEALAGVENNAKKRAAVRIEVERVASWNHGKLAG